MRKSHRYTIQKRVVINMLGGNAIEGVIVDQRGPLLIVKDAKLHEQTADQPAHIDGEAIIDVSHIDFIQAF